MKIANQTVERLTFTVPLSFKAHAIASDCARHKTHPHKAKKIYLQTLAIYAVNVYLSCMGFETEWEISDSRNPLMLKFMDVADLDIKNLGKLECRPILEDTEILQIPPDVWEDRIGYMAVELDSSLKQATILGFARKPAPEIPLTQLKSLEEFIQYMSHLRQATPVNLRHWLEGIVEAGWRGIEELLSPEQLDLALEYREAIEITRGRQINLGMQLADKSFALIVSLTSETETEVDIRVELHPMKGESKLPPGLQLIIIHESGEELFYAEARKADDLIQLEFSAEFGECFSVAITFGEARVTQDFQV